MCLVLGAAAGVAALLGERIPLKNGFGYDGSFWGRITRHLPDFVAERKIDSYSIQRVLPSVIAHYTLRALDLPLQGPIILGFFEVYNAVVLGLGVWLWLLIAKECDLSPAGQWLGFLGLFANFAVMKLTFYCPALFDTSALLVGLLTLYFYMRNSVAGLLIVCLAGLFVWPTTVLVGSLLLLFPIHRRWPERPGRPPTLNTALLLLLALSAVLFFTYTLAVLKVRGLYGVVQPVRPLLPVSLIAVGAYLFFALRALVGPLALVGPEAAAALRAVRSLRRLAAVSVLWAVYLLATRVFASDGPPRVTTREYSMYLGVGTAARPAQFLVAHVVYYGPVLLLAMLNWPAVARHLRSLGAGPTAVSAFAILLGLDSESRHLMNLMPVLVLPTALAAEDLPLSRGVSATIAVFAAILSKCWFPINGVVASLGRAGATFPDLGNYREFPAQAYFMSFGPWISNEMLAIQGAVVTMMALWLLFCTRRAPLM